MCVCITLDRFTDNGWQAAEAVDMMTVYSCLPGADVQRLVLLYIVVITKATFYFCCDELQVYNVHCAP